MSSMKILILFSSSDIGGVEKSLTRMVTVSNEKDVCYVMASFAPAGRWFDWAKELGLSPHALVSADQSFLSRIWSLIKFIQKVRPNVIYVCGLRQALYLRLIKIFNFNSYFKIVHAVRWNPDSSSRLDRGFRYIERYTGFLVSYYITNSDIARRTLIKMCNIAPEKCSVVHNGVSPPKKADVLERAVKNNSILYIANLHPVKGHIPFLETVERVVERVEDAHFFFIGRDEMGGCLQSAIKSRYLEKNITLTGFVSDVERYLSNAKITVLPSLHEGSPTAILESLQSGVPVVAHDIDGIPELIDHEKDGLLVSFQNYEEYADGIISLLLNEERRYQYGQNGKMKVLNHFTIEQCARKHLMLMRGILEK
ncbi:MAG: hypothetical protein COB62_03110 [Piscirickettsiaceae bacterium]|nr:MAG: hypothetical protein COB62_03110 [Piscirickettsiaceae bacterium]